MTFLDTSSATYIVGMFQFCENLETLEIDNFITNNIDNFNNLFDGCNKLSSINLVNFDTTKVTSMINMFRNCYALTSLNFSNIDTSNVKSMNNMFSNCYSLSSLYILNFDTSKVTDMSNMFYNCKLLSSLHLPNFDTSQVITMLSMFEKCSGISTLNLSNFHTNNCNNYFQMFSDCTNLKYVNFYYYFENETTNFTNIIKNSHNEIKLCINVNTEARIYKTYNNNLLEECLIKDEIEETPKISELQSILSSKSNDEILTSFIPDNNRNEISYLFEGKNNSEIYNEIVENIIKDYENVKNNTIYIPGEEDYIFELTNEENKKEKLKNKSLNIYNLSIINLDDCKTLLKKEYFPDRNENISLILLKNEKLTDIPNEKNSQFEVNDPFNKTKLNLSICQNVSIEIYTPIILDDETQKLIRRFKKFRI